MTAVNPCELPGCARAAFQRRGWPYSNSFDRLHMQCMCQCVRTGVLSVFSQSSSARLLYSPLLLVDDVIVLRMGDVIDKTGNHVTFNIKHRNDQRSRVLLPMVQIRTLTVLLSADQFLSALLSLDADSP